MLALPRSLSTMAVTTKSCMQLNCDLQFGLSWQKLGKLLVCEAVLTNSADIRIVYYSMITV
jgi:hypothetical protein